MGKSAAQLAPQSTRSENVKAPHVFAVIAALIGVQLCFGANYVVSKVVVTHFPPLVWAGIRIFIATIVLFAVCFLTRRQKMPALTKEYFLPMIGFAIMGTILNQVFFLKGLSLTTSTNSAVLNTLIPVATLAVVTLRKQEPFNARKGVGFFLALAGVLAMRKIEEVRFSDATVFGDVLTILNCILYGCFLSYSKNFMSKHDSLWTTAFLFLYGTIGINLIAIPSWVEFVPPEMTAQLWAASAFAIVAGTLLAYFLNFWALKYASPSQVALFIYVQPIIAAAIAYIWFDERITVRTAIASMLIFAGMVAAISGNYGKARR